MSIGGILVASFRHPIWTLIWNGWGDKLPISLMSSQIHVRTGSHRNSFAQVSLKTGQNTVRKAQPPIGSRSVEWTVIYFLAGKFVTGRHWNRESRNEIRNTQEDCSWRQHNSSQRLFNLYWSKLKRNGESALIEWRKGWAHITHRRYLRNLMYSLRYSERTESTARKIYVALTWNTELSQ